LLAHLAAADVNSAGRHRAVTASQEAPERRVYSVGEFMRRMAGLFLRTPSLRAISISGEISGLREFNGHLGFTLKEERAVLDCVVWSDARRDLPELSNGLAAIASGEIKVRPDRSGYQLIVTGVEPTGRGELFLLRERLKKSFRDEGLFDPSRKRAVPALPRRIALVSARGKAMHDFIETLKREAPFVDVTFIEAQVQGVGAEIEIAAAIDDASRLNVDVIVITRGGGSYEDLFPFNLEPVVRAIVRAKHPVITAIGHEEDHHLADDAADMRFGTPSLAAEHIARGWVFALRRLRDAERDLARALRGILIQASQRADFQRQLLRRGAAALISSKRAAFSELDRRLDRRSPQRGIADRREQLVRLSGRMGASSQRLLNGVERRLRNASAGLDRMDPLAPLARGYAIVVRAGATISDAASLHAGDLVEARFERGSASARVESVRLDA
jgi:exodeoxyribonuclease VII large subunit